MTPLFQVIPFRWPEDDDLLHNHEDDSLESRVERLELNLVELDEENTRLLEALQTAEIKIESNQYIIRKLMDRMIETLKRLSSLEEEFEKKKKEDSEKFEKLDEELSNMMRNLSI